MTTPQREAELATLCTACGLCCDGSLFGLVPLAEAEVAQAKRLHLEVLDDRALVQPCGALGALGGDDGERRCSVYDERPRACRAFTCQLYERHRREDAPLAQRLAIVRRVRELLAALHAADLRPELDDAPARTEEEQALVDELTLAIARDFGRA